MEWHRSEPREVRPFFAAQKAEAALEESGIRLTSDGDVTRDTSFELDDADLRKLEPSVFPALLNTQMWMPVGISEADLALVILVGQSLLKKSEIVASYSLSSAIPAEIQIPPDLLKSLGGGRNTQISLAVVLAADRSPVVGSPYVSGHWLARKTFSLRTRSTPALFDIRPRTDDEWVANGYPAKTLYAVEYASGIESGPDEAPNSVATVHVHVEAQTRLVDTKLGDAVQPMLAAEIVTSILQQSLADWENLKEPAKGSALETLLKQLSKTAPITLPELAVSVKTKPSRVRALIQSRLNVIQSLK